MNPHSSKFISNQGTLQLSPKSWANGFHPCGINITGDNIDKIRVYQDAPGSVNNDMIGYSEYTPEDTIPLSFKLDSNGDPTCDIGSILINFYNDDGYLYGNDITFVTNEGGYIKYTTNPLNMVATQSDGIYTVETYLMNDNFEGSLYNDSQNLDYPRAFSFDITNNSGTINYYIIDESISGIMADQIINMGFDIPINTIKTTGIYETDFKYSKIIFQSDEPFTLNTLTLYFSDCYKNYPEYNDSQNLDAVDKYYLIDNNGTNNTNLYKLYKNNLPYKFYVSGMNNGRLMDIDNNDNIYILDNIIRIFTSDLSLIKTIDKGVTFNNLACDNDGNLILSEANNLYSLNINTENYNWTYSNGIHPINNNIIDIKVDTDFNIYVLTELNK